MDVSLFALSELPGKGMGMVAQQDIAAGTVICTDHPLIVIEGGPLGFRDICQRSSKAEVRLHYQKTLPLVRQKFSDLAADQQAQVAQLYDANLKDDARRLREAMVTDLRRREWISVPFNDIYIRSPELEGTGKSAAGIWETNCIPEGDRNAQGLYPIISRFNHSCVPNAMYQWRDHVATNVVVVTRDVKQGEEICVSYFNSLFMDQGERNKRTMLSWGFECKCSACSIVPPDIQELQKRMQSMSDAELDEIPQDTFAIFEKAAHSNMRRQQLWGLEQSMERAMSRQHGLQMLEEMRELFEQEDLLPNLKVETKLAFDRLNLEVIYGRRADARKATSDLLKLSELLYGQHDEQTVKYRAWKDSARGAPTPEQLHGGDPITALIAGLSSMY